MELILHTFNGVLTIMLIIGVGFAIERKGWLSEEGIGLISKLVNYISLPAFMVSSIVRNFSRQQLIDMADGMTVPFVTMVGGYIIARIMAHYLVSEPRHRAIFTIGVAFSNTIFIGLPLCVALFGEKAVPYIMLYYMANTFLFWTIGVHDLASDSGIKAPLISRQTLKSVFSPSLMGFFIGVGMTLFNIPMPSAIFRTLSILGNMMTPLAMIFIGIGMSRNDWKHFKLDKELIFAVIGRFLVCPLIVLVVLPFANLNPLMGQVFVMMAAMPAMANISIVSQHYGGDYQYAAMEVAVTTLVAIFVLPIYMWIIH